MTQHKKHFHELINQGKHMQVLLLFIKLNCKFKIYLSLNLNEKNDKSPGNHPEHPSITAPLKDALHTVCMAQHVMHL